MTSIRSTMAAALLVMGMIVGCERVSGTSTAKYIVGRQNGKATLRIGSVTVIFEAAPFAGADDSHVNSGSIVVGGPSTASGSSSTNELTIKTAYRDGVQTVTVNNQSIEVIDNGAAIRFKDRVVKTSDSHVLNLRADGSTGEAR